MLFSGLEMLAAANVYLETTWIDRTRDGFNHSTDLHSGLTSFFLTSLITLKTGSEAEDEVVLTVQSPGDCFILLQN